MFGVLYVVAVTLGVFGVVTLPSFVTQGITALQILIVLRDSCFHFVGLFSLCGLYASVGLVPAMGIFGSLRIIADLLFNNFIKPSAYCSKSVIERICKLRMSLSVSS
jgi:sulfite exporter TauE/SafE